ncbi:la-related protein 6C [Macadamia integrifolia]|uniref:la-related protein 6C n=1 Tax=Macadamia integrifolia TaxID=60698 RepID=UPI001C4FDFD9|nr:la-related protein 6C [Macadamia integrifolia]
MAQANAEEKFNESREGEMKMMNDKKTETTSFKFNAQAEEFVPRAQTQMPLSGYFYPCFDFLGGSSGSDWFYVAEREPVQLIPSSNIAVPNSNKNFLTNDLRQKIIKQVEHQFSDMSLVASDLLAKHTHKDPEGYVPISVIASLKKIKSLVSNNHLLVQALRSSSKLIVSDDGKKVKRKHLFTERDKEELQSRIVHVENLPEDYSHPNLEKIFGVVGSVKTIRICHPQESSASRSKSDVLISNKLHALVEYETIDQAEKAVEKLNDERNWRKGLRVRLLLRRSPRSVIKSRKSDYDHFDRNSDEDEASHSESLEDSRQSNNVEQSIENNAEDNSTGTKKGWARGRGKSRGRLQGHNARGLISPSPQSSSSIQCEASTKPTPKGPRMPDGTRGFTMGRGKPVSTLGLDTPSSTVE